MPKYDVKYSYDDYKQQRVDKKTGIVEQWNGKEWVSMEDKK